MKTRLALALAALLAVAGSVRAESASNLLSFADGLLQEQDYYRAITEYKRYLHHYPLHPDGQHAQFGIGLAYYRGGQWEAAADAFRTLYETAPQSATGIRARLLAAEAYYAQDEPARALDAFNTFARLHPDHPDAADARMRMTQCLIRLDRMSLATNQAVRSAAALPGSDRLRELAGTAPTFMRYPRKSPALAGTLSALLPGAGQLYVGRKRDAGISFILNGSLIALAVAAFHNDEPVAGGLVSLIGVSWYAGNIYGAVGGAHKFNRDQRRRLVESLDIRFGIMRDADRNAVPSAGLSLSF